MKIEPIMINIHPKATSRLCLPISTPHNFAVITVETKDKNPPIIKISPMISSNSPLTFDMHKPNRIFYINFTGKNFCAM